jgi:drug/metabolite transporter (DMT)-like permease
MTTGITIARHSLKTTWLQRKYYMETAYAGEIAAFGTVLCWTVGSQCFEAAGKRIGSLSVNLIRLLIAFLLFCVTLFITQGEIVPTDFPASAWKWLIISGLIGFTFGDMCLFSAFVRIGPRLAMLIMTLTAPITALIGWAFLNEKYSDRQWVGVLVTLIGVSWVILQKNGNNKSRKGAKKVLERDITWQGVMLGFGGALGQAVGFIFSKVGMMYNGTYLDPFAATQVRVIGGTCGFVVLFFVLGWWPNVINSTKNASAIGFTAAGSFLGPYLGVSLSLLALHYTTTGVASTIMSLVPITLIPFAIFLHKEHVSIHGFIGTLVAICGVLMLIN